MKVEDFDNFYEVVIFECIKKVKSELEAYNCVAISISSKYKIYKNYQFKRDLVKKNYMDKGDVPGDVSLDRHKIAACMIYAILKAQPIKINRWIRNLPEKAILANEYLAFFVALNIIEMYRQQELGYANNYEIFMPKTYYEDMDPENTFLSNICKGMHYIRIDNMKKFDVFAYSNILFLIEKYTDA